MCAFKVVFIAEAHAKDIWNVGLHTSPVKEAKSVKERYETAKVVAKNMFQGPISFAVDTMDNELLNFGVWPFRIIAFKNGIPIYQNKLTKEGFDFDETEEWMKQTFGEEECST